MNGQNKPSTCFLFPNVVDFDIIEAESLFVLKVATLKEYEENNFLPMGTPVRRSFNKYYQFLVRYRPYSYEA